MVGKVGGNPLGSAHLPDVVFVVRPGDDNEELRYSLRSVAANVPHRKVWIAGHCPWWVKNVERIELTPLPDRFDNQHQSLTAAVNHPDLADEFYYWNDDIYAMRPFRGYLPTLHLGPLREYVDLLITAGKNPENGWLLGMQEMLELLASWGIDDPLCYEGHMPVRFRKADMVRFVQHRTRHFLPASFYAATDLDPGEQWIDAQPGILGDPLAEPSPPFLSSDDFWFERSRIGDRVRAEFPTPCVYEGVPASVFGRSA
jgi:hypothetical protein